MKRTSARSHLIQDVYVGVRIALPSVAGLMAGLCIAQFAPTVSAATSAPRQIVKPHPLLAAAAKYPENYTILRSMKFAAPINFGDWVWTDDLWR